MTCDFPLRISIRSTKDGYYHWELRDGPYGGFEHSGLAPLLERCFEEILLAQWRIAEHLTGEPDPAPSVHANNTPDLAPVAQVQTPSGVVLPPQEDSPSVMHTPGPHNFYLHPPNFG